MRSHLQTRGYGFTVAALLSVSLLPGAASAQGASPAPRKAAATAAPYPHPEGFRFAPPAGWSVATENGTHLLVPAEKHALEMYLILVAPAQGVSRADDPGVPRLAEQDIKPLFPFVERVGTAEPIKTGLGPGVKLAWEGESPTAVQVRAEMYLVISGGKSIALIAVGPRDRVAGRNPALRQVFTSFAPSAPAPSRAKAAPRPAPGGADRSPLAKQWRERLSGMKLTYLTSYSSGSSGGYNARWDLTLNADGTFVYQGSSSVSIYASDYTGTSAGRDANTGKWRVFTRGNQAILETTPEGGTPRHRELALVNGKTHLDGTRVFVTEP